MVETDELDIGIEEHGDPRHPTVVLLHGWPDDVRCWDGIAGALADAGFHVVVPYLRGFGPTFFRSVDKMRSGQLTALASDVIGLMDALAVDRFAVVGHDWGARAAYICAAVWPQRVTACVAMSVAWGTNTPQQTLSLEQTQHYWYQWLMGLPRGAQLVREQRREFTRYIWQLWTPEAEISDDDFERTAASFDNADWAEITLHSYRVRWGGATTDSAYDAIEAKVADVPQISVPTHVLHGGADTATLPDSTAGREHLFSGHYSRTVLDGLGHFPQRTAPDRVLEEILPFLQRFGS